MAKPNYSGDASLPIKPKNVKPKFIRPMHVMTAGSSKGCMFRWPPRTPPQFVVHSSGK